MNDEQDVNEAQDVNDARTPCVLRPLRELPVRYAQRDLARAVDAVSAAPLSLPAGQVYWVEARGRELFVGGENGIPAFETSLERVHDDAVSPKRAAAGAHPDLVFALDALDAAASPQFATLRLRRRRTAPNQFINPAVDDFDAIPVEAPAHWRFRPKAIELEITQRCNMRCVGCAIIDDVERGLEGFDAARALAILHDAAIAGIWGVALTGGEPFLKVDLLCDIVRDTPLDVLKIQTNAKVFVDAARTTEIFQKLADAGLGRRNRYVRPSINVSIGMQTDAGTPIANVAHIIANAPRVFGDRVNVVLNALVHGDDELDALLRGLDAEHRALYGRRLSPERVMRVARLSYNATPRLIERGLVSLASKTVRQRIEELPDEYLCLNFERDVATPLPRILVRADGALHPCSCFGFVASPGNVQSRSLTSLLDDVNADPLFLEVADGSLRSLFTKVVAQRPDIAERALPSTSSICKVCKAMREPDAPLFDPS